MGVGVLKLLTPTLKSMPLYIGKVLRIPMHNVSHMYREDLHSPTQKLKSFLPFLSLL